MKFGPPDSDDEQDDSSSLNHSYTSDESASDEREEYRDRPEPRSKLGAMIRAYIDSSASESDFGEDLDSEDEVELLGDGIVRDTPEKAAWREAKRPAKLSFPLKEIKTRWRLKGLTKNLPVNPKYRSRIEDLLQEKPSEYENWLKSTEEAAMRDGHKTALHRRGELRDIASNARLTVRSEAEKRAARDEEEMRRLLEALAIRQTREEAELAKKFAEREKQLWADIDAAIKAVEQKEAELAAAALATARKAKEEEEVRVAAEVKAADARRAEAAAFARQKAETEKAEREEKVLAARELEAKNAQATEAAKAQEEKGKVGMEWKEWVEKKRWMKKEVIEVFKGDRELKTRMRTALRLTTRRLGQVVNTREDVVRVTNQLHDVLVAELPSAPSSQNPLPLSPPPPIPYTYFLSHIAKALITQAQSEVSAKQEAAFPLARVVLGLLLRGHAALGEVLFARFVKKCPWVVPFYPSRQPNQPREEYEKSTGRGADEALGDYIQRMCGITTLYFAILQTPLSSLIPTLPSIPTPHQLAILIPPHLRLTAAWTWLANTLRDPTPGMPPICSMISIWVEVVGAEAQKVWGHKQVQKIYEAIQREGLDGGKVKGDGEAARARLRIALGKESVYPPGREYSG